MDEPLSNLDAKLRVQMPAEISRLHNRLATTTIYVTHDQTEAMTMVRRLVVMKYGIIQQVGEHKHVYDYPDSVFVGGFIGSPSMNFFTGHLEEDYFMMGDTKIKVPEGKMKTLRNEVYLNKDLILGIRLEDIHDEPLCLKSTPETKINAHIDVAELMGSESSLYSKINDQDFVARVESRTDIHSGESIELALNLNHAHFFDAESELRIK